MSFVERAGRNSWRVRYWRDDGTHGSISGFPTHKAAEAKAREIDSDRGRGEFIDPDAGNLSLPSGSVTWFDALDVAPATAAQYRSLTRTHILPRWGATASTTSAASPSPPGPRSCAPATPPATVTTIVKAAVDDARRRRRRTPHPRQPHPRPTPRPPPPRHRHRGRVGHPRPGPARSR